jgi:hypothetical protein
MAEALSEPAAPTAGPEPEPEPERRAAAAVRHAKRFRIIMGALTFVAVAALVLAGVLAATSTQSTDSGPSWAAFKPTSDKIAPGASQIADYVGRQYRLPNNQQIVLVTGGPMELQDLPMKIAVREPAAAGGDIDVVEGKGVLYRMCGLGDKCAIASGKATPERALLLRREALELALYSFHDLDDIQNVVVFMPPAKGEEPSFALHFRRGEVAGPLAQPLKATLPSPVPNPDTITTAPGTPFIERVTITNLFKFSLTAGNRDANVFLVLEPLPTDS